MPRKPIGETAMTDAERQARYRAARAAGKPVIRMRRPLDHRGRARRWNDNVAGLVEAQVEYAAWLDSLPDNLRDSATRRSTAGDLRSGPHRTSGDHPAARLRQGLTALAYHPAACTGGSTGTPRAPLRQPLDGHSASRGSPLWTTGTSRHAGGSILDADRGSLFRAD